MSMMAGGGPREEASGGAPGQSSGRGRSWMVPKGSRDDLDQLARDLSGVVPDGDGLERKFQDLSECIQFAKRIGKKDGVRAKYFQEFEYKGKASEPEWKRNTVEREVWFEDTKATDELHKWVVAHLHTGNKWKEGGKQQYVDSIAQVNLRHCIAQRGQKGTTSSFNTLWDGHYLEDGGCKMFKYDQKPGWKWQNLKTMRTEEERVSLINQTNQLTQWFKGDAPLISRGAQEPAAGEFERFQVLEGILEEVDALFECGVSLPGNLADCIAQNQPSPVGVEVLVIGNNEYVVRGLLNDGKLRNCVGDAIAVKEAFDRLGARCRLLKNVQEIRDLEDEVDGWAKERLRGKEVRIASIIWAGHALSHQGETRLLPTFSSASPAETFRLRLRRDTMALRDLIAEVRAHNAECSIQVVLDSCRNEVQIKDVTFGFENSVIGKDAEGSGNVDIIYSTAYGITADDNSPFKQSLLECLGGDLVHGTIVDFWQVVKEKTISRSKGKQAPKIELGSTRGLTLLPPKQTAAPAAEPEHAMPSELRDSGVTALPRPKGLQYNLDGAVGASELRRESLLERLRGWLSKTAGGSERICLYGMGGAGKSTLARQFLVDVYREGGLGIVAFLHADKLFEEYIELGVALELGKKTDLQRQSGADMRDMIFTELRRRAGQWLVVIDDVPASDTERQEMEGEQGGMYNFPFLDGRSILTSRSSAWDAEGDGIGVGSFGEDEAVSWVLSRAKMWRAQEEGVRRLVKRLECYPLALRQAVDYSVSVKLLGPLDYLAEMDGGHERDWLEKKRKKHDCSTYPFSIVEVVHLSVGKIIDAEQEDSVEAVRLLKFLSFLHHTEIPIDLVPEKWRLHLELLQSQSLVMDAGVSKRAVKMHSITQDVVRTQLMKHSKAEMIGLAADQLWKWVKRINEGKRATFFIGWMCQSHVRRLVENVGTAVPRACLDTLRRLVKGTAIFLATIGCQYAGASSLYQWKLQIEVKHLGHDHVDVAKTQYNMANAHRKMNKIEEARRLFLSCAEVFVKVYGAQHSKTLDAQNQAASCGN